MGVELLPLKPQPHFLIYKDYFGPIRLNYGARRYLEDREKVGFLKLFWIWIKTHPSVRRKSKDSYMYFKNGSPFFMDRLACYLTEIGGKIQTSSRVIDIEKNGKNYLTITCLNGAIKTVLKARKLYISRSFDLLKNLNFEIKTLKNIKRQKHREVLIEYYGSAPTFSLVTIDDKQSIIKMVSVQKVNREENRNVLAIRLKAEIKNNSLNDIILRELSKFKLIEKNCQILVSKKLIMKFPHLETHQVLRWLIMVK